MLLHSNMIITGQRVIGGVLVDCLLFFKFNLLYNIRSHCSECCYRIQCSCPSVIVCYPAIIQIVDLVSTWLESFVRLTNYMREKTVLAVFLVLNKSKQCDDFIFADLEIQFRILNFRRHLDSMLSG